MILQKETKSLPVALITGYLGAGKTTLLNELLKHPNGHKVAVIVNDIGEINIDASLIEKGGTVAQVDDSLVPLSNGCICCTLKNDLIDQIVSLAKMDKFDYIVIEASGICEPIPIAQTLTMMQESAETRGIPEVCHLDNIISVVDAYRLAQEFDCGVDFEENREKFEAEEDIQSLLIQQMEFANIVVLNKVELVDDQQKEQIKAVIHALCPDCKIIETNYGKVDPDQLLDTDNFDFEKAYYSEGWVKALSGEEHDHDHHDHDHEEHEHHHEHDENCTCGCHDHHHGHEGHHHADEVFTSWGKETAHKYTEEELDYLLKALSETDAYGTVLRSKGIIQMADGSWKQFDMVPEEYEVREGQADYTGRVCVIGTDLKEEDLIKLFHI